MRGRTVALIVALAAVISGGAVAATLLTSGSDEADARALVPEDAFVYVEASRELTESQRTACDEIAARFPDAADCDAVADQIRGAIDSQLEKEDQTWEDDIEPWLGDEFAFFMTTDNLGELIEQSQNPPQIEFDSDQSPEEQFEEMQQNLTLPTLAALIAVDDEERAVSYIEDLPDSDFEEKSYEGIDYFYEGAGAWATVDGYLVVGTEAGLKAVIDQREADSSIEDVERFTDAEEGVRDDRVGMAWADLQPLLDAYREHIPPEFPPAAINLFEEFVQQPVTATAFLEDDSGAIEVTSSSAAHELFGYTAPGGGGEGVLAQIPADSWGGIAIDDVAGQVNTILGFAGSSFPGGSVVLEQQFKKASGLDLQDDILSWMGPSALFVRGEAPQEMQGGIVIETSDPTTTARTILRLERFFARDGAPTQLITRSGFRGFMAQEPGMPQAVIIAVGDQRAVALWGSEELLDELAEGETLESSGRFDEIKGVAGEEFATAMFFDIDTIRELIEMSAVPDPDYTENVRPFLEPLDIFVYGSMQEDDVARDRYVVSVDE